MIALENLNKTYTTNTGSLHALKNIHLTVAPGEIVGVIGRSGAGKSTLLRCVNLLERPTSGAVIVNDVDLMTLTISQLRQARHRIGMVFQHFNLLSTVTVFNNVALPLRLLKKSKTIIEKTVHGLLDKVGLLHLARSYPHQLSGGEKQRVAIARALATKPNILLCDEMTSALDPETTTEILTLVRELHQELRLSILCITHEMEVIKAIADRVAVIDGGNIVECEDIVTLFQRPKTAVTQQFVQSALRSTLPADLQSCLQETPITNGHVVLRLTFTGHAAVEPIINTWAQQAHVNVNILQANIEKLRQVTIGRMIVSVDLSGMELSQITAFLKEKTLTVEVMGYVDAHAWFVN